MTRNEALDVVCAAYWAGFFGEPKNTLSHERLVDLLGPGFEDIVSANACRIHVSISLLQRTMEDVIRR